MLFLSFWLYDGLLVVLVVITVQEAFVQTCVSLFCSLRYYWLFTSIYNY